MKQKFVLFAAGLMAFGPLASFGADDTPKLTLPGRADAGTTPAALSSTNYSEAQLLEEIGWFLAKNSQADTFDFTPEQLTTVWKGFQAGAAGKDAPIDFEKIGPQLKAYVDKRQEAYLAKLKDKGTAETAAFFADLKKKNGVTVLPSGLAFEVLKPGTGPNVKATDTIRAHYTGKLINGDVFDTSREPMQPGQAAEPAEFPLDGVIPGWTEGLQKINKGGQIRLYVPPQLAYGDEGRGGIPPASTLIFDVEVIDIKPTPGPASLTPSLGK